MNGLTRGRVDVNIKSASEDGKGKVHFRFRGDEGKDVVMNKAYADYKLGSVTLAVGPQVGFPGNFSDSTVRGLKVSTKVAGFDIAVGVADKNTSEEADGWCYSVLYINYVRSVICEGWYYSVLYINYVRSVICDVCIIAFFILTMFAL